jgi:Tfp pilus assembly PilM family ATPase
MSVRDWLSSTALTPIGLDIGARTIKAVQLRQRGPGVPPAIHAVARCPRPDNAPPLPSAEEFAHLGEILARRGFAGRRIVLAVPSAMQSVVPLQLPQRSPGTPIDEIAHAQAADALRADAEALQLAWWPLPQPPRRAGPSKPGASGPTTSAALGVAARTADVTALIDAAELAGFEPVAVDAHALALARALGEHLAPAPAITAIVDLGQNAAEIVLLAERTVVYQRTLPELGLFDTRRQLIEAVDGDEEAADYLLATVGFAGPSPHPALIAQLEGLVESITRELRVSLAYADGQLGQAENARVLVVGGGADIPGLPDRLAAALPETALTRLSLADLFEHTAAGQDVNGAAGVAAAGLALHTEPEGAPAC